MLGPTVIQTESKKKSETFTLKQIGGQKETFYIKHIMTNRQTDRQGDILFADIEVNFCYHLVKVMRKVK
jgi:hypothetical protein